MNLIDKYDLKRYQDSSTVGLKFSVREKSVVIKNRFNDVIACLDLSLVHEGIYCDSWFGYVDGAEYKEVMNGIFIDLFMKSHCTKKICCTGELKIGMDSGTAKWFSEALIPKMIKSGLKYNAIVTPVERYAKQSMAYFEQSLEHKLAMFFPEFDIARLWLNAVDNS